MNNSQWQDLLFNLSISLLGGFIKTLTSKSKNRSFSKFVASAAIGGFAGLLTYMLCSNFGFSWQITSFATGVAGYMGDSILRLFSEFLPKLLSGKLNVQLTEKSKENTSNDSSDDEE